MTQERLAEQQFIEATHTRRNGSESSTSLLADTLGSSSKAVESSESAGSAFRRRLEKWLELNGRDMEFYPWR